MEDINLPSHINKEFFKRTLKNGLQLDDNIEILDVKISLATSAGDNYTSKIYRSEVHYKENKGAKPKYVSLIVKDMLQNVMESDVVEELLVFDKEVEMYTEIMPRVEKLYNNTEKFVPKYYYSEKQGVVNDIVFEDLKPLGFAVANRVERLGETHSKILLRKLARFHAATYVLREKEPHLLENFKEGFFQVKNFYVPIFQSCLIKGFDQIIEVISSWNSHEYERFTGKIKKFVSNLRNMMSTATNFDAKSIIVLNHSDAWTNNMMFKYENGKVRDVFLIDLQVSTIGGPGLDVMYFLNTSVKYEVLIEKRDELYKHYYESFKEGLIEIKYPESKIPTWEMMKNEIDSKEFFGFSIFVNIAPIIMLDNIESKDSNFDILTDEITIRKKRASVYSTPKYQEFLKYSLKRCEKMGLFD